MAGLAGFHLGGPESCMTRIYQLLWPKNPPDFETRSPSLALLPWLDRFELSPPLGGQSDADTNVELSQQFLYLDLTKWPAFRCLEHLTDINYSRVLIRPEYNELLEDVLKVRGRYFFTGQPGIGKSVGLSIILCELLARGQDVAYQTSTTLFLFTADGVYISPSNNDNISADSVHLWNFGQGSPLLIDVDLNKCAMPSQWHILFKRVIWASSPNDEPWRTFYKQFKAEKRVCRPWQEDEIAAQQQLQDIEREALQSKWAISGPVARGLFQRGCSIEKPDVESAVAGVLQMGIRNALLLAHGVSGSVGQDLSLPYSVFLVYPLVRADETLNRRVDIFSFLSQRTEEAFVDLLGGQVELLQKTYAELLIWPRTRTLAAQVLRQVIHRRISTERRSETLGPCFNVALDQALLTFQIHGKVHDFIGAEPARAASHQNVYLVPSRSVFQAVDAILVTPTSCSLLQIIAEETHSFSLGGVCAVLERLDLVLEGRIQTLPVKYCVVGSDAGRVESVASFAKGKLRSILADPTQEGNAVTADKLLAKESRRNWLGLLETKGIVFSLANGQFREAV